MYRKLLKSDKAHKNVEILDSVVSMQHTSVHPSTEGTRHEQVWHLDFTDVNENELRLLAAEHLVIQFRNNYKAQTETNWDGRRFSIREYLDKERRQRKSDREKTADTFKKMTKEDQKAFLEEQLAKLQ